MSRLPALFLVLALLSAGCIGAQIDPAADVAAAPAEAPAVLASQSAEWSHAGGSAPFEIGERLEVPAGADGILVDFTATVAGPRGALTVRAIGPDGEAHVIGMVTTPVVAGRTGSAWQLLPGEAGEWRFTGSSQTASEGTLNVTVVQKAALAPVQGAGADRVVVAVVDTGVNPYHETFQRPDLATSALPPRIVDAANGQAPLSVPLGHGAADYLGALRADAALWTAVPAETLVHFDGTNLLGYHVGDVALPAIPVLDRAGHGTAVSHSVTQENPDVLVVMVTAADWDAAVRWIATQPWIDLVSLSWGPPVNAVGPVWEKALGMVTPEATRAVNDAGKVVFGASGNDPTPTFTDTTSGPIWVHAVSGSEAAQHGRALASGNFVDTVANWTQTLATHQSLNDTREISGTSFATPTTAGVASRILHETRTRAGHEGGIVEGALVRTENVTVLNADLRTALNATAVYWSTTEYGGPEAIPVAPAPWMSMGWGHVDGSIVTAAVDLLLGVAMPEEKPAAARVWMQAHHDLRDDSWGG